MTRQRPDRGGGAERALELSEFVEYLEIHGARLERWPATLSGPARVLLAASAQARQARDEAARLDALLDALPPIAPSATLQARIASLPAAHPRRGFRAWWPFESVSRPAFAWLTAAIVGIAVGRMLPADSIDEPSSADAGAQSSEPVAARTGDESSDGSDLDAQDWDELTELSFAYGLEVEDSP